MRRSLKAVALFATVVALTLTACSKKELPASSAAANSPAAATDTAIDPATVASITGSVTYDGPPIAPVSIDMKSEPACAQANSSLAAAQPLIVDAHKKVANVVVYVKSGLGPHHFNPPPNAVALDQNGCVYKPRVVALMVTQTLEIHNSDATIHNVHAMPRANSEWNKAQSAGGKVLRTSFSRPELAIPFMCNVHPWMRAFVFVFDHPYYAVTAGSGEFNLHNLPPGTYTIEAWQEELGTQSQQITLGPRESQHISFRFSGTHTN